MKLDPGYAKYDEGIANDYFAKTPEGEVYVNEVWPGEAVYPDFGKPDVRKWWAENQKFLVDLGVRGTWNDMNEPASFRGDFHRMSFLRTRIKRQIMRQCIMFMDI